MLIKTYGGAVHGIDAMIITAEVNVSGGNSYSIVGLPDNAVRESYKRIDAAFRNRGRSEEHTSELQSLMRISYAVFCLNKKNILVLTHTRRPTTSHLST